MSHCSREIQDCMATASRTLRWCMWPWNSLGLPRKACSSGRNRRTCPGRNCCWLLLDASRADRSSGTRSVRTSRFRWQAGCRHRNYRRFPPRHLSRSSRPSHRFRHCPRSRHLPHPHGRPWSLLFQPSCHHDRPRHRRSPPSYHHDRPRHRRSPPSYHRGRLQHHRYSRLLRPCLLRPCLPPSSTAARASAARPAPAGRACASSTRPAVSRRRGLVQQPTGTPTAAVSIVPKVARITPRRTCLIFRFSVFIESPQNNTSLLSTTHRSYNSKLYPAIAAPQQPKYLLERVGAKAERCRVLLDLFGAELHAPCAHARVRENVLRHDQVPTGQYFSALAMPAFEVLRLHRSVRANSGGRRFDPVQLHDFIHFLVLLTVLRFYGSTVLRFYSLDGGSSRKGVQAHAFRSLSL